MLKLVVVDRMNIPSNLTSTMTSFNTYLQCTSCHQNKYTGQLLPCRHNICLECCARLREPPASPKCPACSADVKNIMLMLCRSPDQHFVDQHHEVSHADDITTCPKCDRILQKQSLREHLEATPCGRESPPLGLSFELRKSLSPVAPKNTLCTIKE